MVNTVQPDQMPQSTASHLDLQFAQAYLTQYKMINYKSNFSSHRELAIILVINLVDFIIFLSIYICKEIKIPY